MVNEYPDLQGLMGKYFALSQGFEGDVSNAVSDHYIQNASFFKLDNVTLGWTVDNVIDNNPMRLYISADNLLTITEYEGIDPEITGGLDSNFYPRSRAVALGLDINF